MFLIVYQDPSVIYYNSTWVLLPQPNQVIGCVCVCIYIYWDVLLWIPTHGRAKAGRPARMYIQQLCEDTGCCPEDLPRAMNDREEWRERVRDIHATSAIWWWWYTHTHTHTRFFDNNFLYKIFINVLIFCAASYLFVYKVSMP